MKNFLKPVPDPIGEADLDHVLRVAQFFIDRGRPLPSEVVMLAIELERHWPGREIPSVIVEAQRVLRRQAR